MRLGLYLIPPADHPLAEAGARWLSGAVTLPAVTRWGVEVGAVTAVPRRYGFHATLRAPFALAPEWDEAAVRDLARTFAAARSPISAPPLRVAVMDRCVALVPAPAMPDSPAGQTTRALGRLADACLRAFDPCRAPLTPADLARRRAAGLRPDEEAHLVRWGYPFVLNRFRFHLTLTGPIADPLVRVDLARALAVWLAPVLTLPLVFPDLVLVREAEPGARFVVAARLPFACRPCGALSLGGISSGR